MNRYIKNYAIWAGFYLLAYNIHRKKIDLKFIASIGPDFSIRIKNLIYCPLLFIFLSRSEHKLQKSLNLQERILRAEFIFGNHS